MKAHTFLSAVMLAASLLAPATVAAEEANLARSKAVSYQYVDDQGQAVTVEKDAACAKLIDGVRTDQSAVPSDWGANKAKAMRVRFDFTHEVHPSRLVVVWMFAQQASHQLDRIRVLAGNDPAALQEVTTLSDIEASGRNVLIDIPLSDASGQYVELVLEQDASPEHKMFSISEIEVFGPQSERDLLDGK